MKSFKEYIVEKVLSIGINPTHEHFREIHRKEIHDMIHKSYKDIGGYGGHESGSKEESDAIHHDINHSLIKATKRNGKLTAVSIYKKTHGRKLIAAGSDGTKQGSADFKKTNLEDNTQKRSWAEVSGAVEKISRDQGFPEVSSDKADTLLKGKKITKEKGSNYYTRDIGGKPHKKIMLGHPKQD